MNKENIFLKIINDTIKDNSYLGDDCAFLKEFKLVVSTDTLVEDVHFKMSYFTPCEIGKKAVIVNVSDILASGAEPLYITISLSGRLDENFISEFYKGANEMAQKYKVKIIGGDLTGGDKISVTITVLGGTKNRKISSRKNAKVMDNVYLKGIHGSSAEGLKLLQEGAIKDLNNEFIKAHIEPEIYPFISFEIAKNVKYDYAMMDTSDGLYDALDKISKASGVGFDINYSLIEKKTDNKNSVLFGGEDYGLLICLNPSDTTIADKLNLRKIGIVTDTKKIIIDGKEISDKKIFNHFK